MNPVPTAAPSAGRIVRTLKDGYWDRTEVVALADGTQRVRKRNKGGDTPGLWGVESLRRELRYLQTLPPAAATGFPPLLAHWDRVTAGTPDIGYEMPYYPQHADAGHLARAGRMGQPEIDDFQRQLAEVVFERLHAPELPLEAFSKHLADTVNQAFTALSADPALAALIEAETITLNGRLSLGPRAALGRIVRSTPALVALDAAQSVRIHGDLFLENILWRHHDASGPEPRLILVDPVSVAGVACALPLFDLVKYESYATGELWALRSERVEVDGIGAGTGHYRYRIRTEDAALQPFLTHNWHGLFREAFERKHGAVDQRLYSLIDGYFSAAMAVNTSGVQRQARLLKATADLNAVLR